MNSRSAGDCHRVTEHGPVAKWLIFGNVRSWPWSDGDAIHSFGSGTKARVWGFLRAGDSGAVRADRWVASVRPSAARRCRADLAKRPIVCLDMPKLNTLFCSTHLTAGRSDVVNRERALQVEKIHAIFAPSNDAGRNIIFGADMNMRPHDPILDSVYEPSYGGGAYGIYRDAHPDRTTKAGTTDGGSPIDYIFVNDVPSSISPPRITPVEYSDHHLYEATVTVH